MIQQNGLFRLLLAALLLAPLPALHAAAADSPRERHSLDQNWKFNLGDNWQNVLRMDKAGMSGGPAGSHFNAAAWRTVNLPHDWAVELPFDGKPDKENKEHGFKPVGPGFTANNVGWYRRSFDLAATDQGKRIWLQFDGVFRDATVWVNGWFVQRNEGGYYPFREDITDLVRYGGLNTIAVKVDVNQFEGWYYEGAGIYRHVWLEKTAPVAIAPEGIFVTSTFPDNQPGPTVKIGVETSLTNTLDTAAKTKIVQEIISPEGKSVATAEAQAEVPAHGTQDSKQSIGLSAPVLWSPESPKLYQLVTTVRVDGKVVDRKQTEFGIRTVAFDPNKGFMLNGKAYPIYGTCNHHDHAGVGVALPDAVQYFRISKLKEMGSNAYRAAHNPPTTELLEACDRLGMLVMSENRLLGSDSENLRRLASMVRRDRNHPSVVIWSICNEEPRQEAEDAGRIGATMQSVIKQLDPTRPVTAGANRPNINSGLMGTVEVRGWNYQTGNAMDEYHAQNPKQPHIGTEQGSYVATRGIYENDPKRAYVGAYVQQPNGKTPQPHWWSYFADRPWLSGGFIWTGFDYRGEPTPYAWPNVNSHFGVFDTCGFPKDEFYYYQSWWTSKPVLHLLPHWNWAGREGQEIRVDALSNCEEVELFLNGVSLGKQPMPKNDRLSWKVNYAPGTLSAKGFTQGKVIAETKVTTTGEPARTSLQPDHPVINADGADASLITVAVTDANGAVVPTAGHKINFVIAGPGKIIGVGNGDPSCHEPDTLITPPPVVTKVAVKDWKVKITPIAGDPAASSQIALGFDDSAWGKLEPETGDERANEVPKGQEKYLRARINLTAADVAGGGPQLSFAGINGESWVFINGHLLGHEMGRVFQKQSYQTQQQFRAGENVITVVVRSIGRSGSRGGFNPSVTLETYRDNPKQPAWSRSVFSGLAQVIVQSTGQPGDITLTASADGLKPVTTTIKAQATTGSELSP